MSVPKGHTPRTYLVPFVRRVVAHAVATSCADAARTFDVPLSTVGGWRRQQFGPMGTQLKRRIKAELATRGPSTVTELRAALSLSSNTVCMALRKYRARGFVVVTTDRKRQNRYALVDVHPKTTHQAIP